MSKFNNTLKHVDENTPLGIKILRVSRQHLECLPGHFYTLKSYEDNSCLHVEEFSYGLDPSRFVVVED